MTRNADSRLAWVLTGSGHYLKECLAFIETLDAVDIFLSRAAAEVLRMYDIDPATLRARGRVFRDTSASSVPVGLFYHGQYHTVVIAPATSNTVAKCVCGISDTLPTNLYAQAGKCRVPAIVFACDTAPALQSEAPDGMVPVYPRRIDLDNAARLKTFEATTVVEDMAALEAAVRARLQHD